MHQTYKNHVSDVSIPIESAQPVGLCLSWLLRPTLWHPAYVVEAILHERLRPLSPYEQWQREWYGWWNPDWYSSEFENPSSKNGIANRNSHFPNQPTSTIFRYPCWMLPRKITFDMETAGHLEGSNSLKTVNRPCCCGIAQLLKLLGTHLIDQHCTPSAIA